MPGDDAAIGFAREWLRTAGLLPNNVDDGKIVSRSEETNRVIVQFIPLEPENMIAAYPSAVVTIGPGGDIIEASVRWPEIDRYDIYQLRDPKDAWAEVASGEAYLEVELPDGIADDEGVVSGKATYTSVEIGYTTAGLPGGAQYLQPVYIFVGRFTPEGSDSSYRIRAYVSAVANSGAPIKHCECSPVSRAQWSESEFTRHPRTGNLWQHDIGGHRRQYRGASRGRRPSRSNHGIAIQPRR